MKNFITISKKMLWLPVVAFLVISMTGCSTDVDNSPYDPNFKADPDPVVTSVSPENTAYAGVSIITINGSNFSSDVKGNVVYFNTTLGTVLSATPTQLTVRVPNLVTDSILLRVATTTAINWGNYQEKYVLQSAVDEFGGFKNGTEVPAGIATDASGNLYVSWTQFNAGKGITKISPDGTRDDNYAPKGPETTWNGMKMGPDGNLYCARNVKAIFSIAPGAKAGTFASTGLGTIYDLDFDRNKVIWAGGNNDYIYSVTMQKVVNSFAFKGNVRSVRVFSTGGKDYVYLAAQRDTSCKIYRMEIQSTTGDKLGPEEEVFNFTANYGIGYIVYSITFTSDGDMYLGTDHSNGIIVVHADRTSESLYSGLIHPKGLFFGWGQGSTLYYTRGASDTSQAVIKMNMINGKTGAAITGAPYYGIQ